MINIDVECAQMHHVVREIDMDRNEVVKAVLTRACLESAHQMGEKVKLVSWFGRNVRTSSAKVAA